MPGGREIIAMLSVENLGDICGHGLSSTEGGGAWSLVMDYLIGLNENVCYTLWYADDIVILTGQKFPKHQPRQNF